MVDLNESHIELFAKLSKILAQTFEDIHKICLNEMQRSTTEIKPYSEQKYSLTHERWNQKKEQQKINNSILEQNCQNSQSESDSLKHNKTKKNKTKAHEINQTNNEQKQKKHQKKKKAAKWQQEGKPRPPLNAFMLFLRHSKFQIMEAKPQLTPSEVSSYASSLWNELPQEDKQKYRTQYRQNRVKYDEQLKQYNNQRQKLTGKTPMKGKKSEGNLKNTKDMLDNQVLDVELSGNSDSMSGI